MNVTIDFSLFSSPTKAYGTVTGNINVPDAVRVGDVVAVLVPREGDWFSGKLRVVSEAQHDQRIVLGLEDLVASSPEEAVHLATRFENEAGLFCDVYDCGEG